MENNSNTRYELAIRIKGVKQEIKKLETFTRTQCDTLMSLLSKRGYDQEVFEDGTKVSVVHRTQPSVSWDDVRTILGISEEQWEKAVETATSHADCKPYLKIT